MLRLISAAALVSALGLAIGLAAAHAAEVKIYNCTNAKQSFTIQNSDRISEEEAIGVQIDTYHHGKCSTDRCRVCIEFGHCSSLGNGDTTFLSRQSTTWSAP